MPDPSGLSSSVTAGPGLSPEELSLLHGHGEEEETSKETEQEWPEGQEEPQKGMAPWKLRIIRGREL